MKHDVLLYCSNHHAHDEMFSRAGDGNRNRFHIQLYLETATKSPIRVGTVIRTTRKHTDTTGKPVSVYVQRATHDAAHCVQYVSKDDTRIDGPWSNVNLADWPELDDVKSAKVKREDLYNAVMDDHLGMAEILSTPTLAVSAASCLRWVSDLIRERDAQQWSEQSTRRDVQVTYIYGASKIGKSEVARQYLTELVGERGFFVVDDYQRDPWSVTPVSSESCLMNCDCLYPPSHTAHSYA